MSNMLVTMFVKIVVLVVRISFHIYYGISKT